MGLIETFDRLIREHGSASIRADQIALLRDEATVLMRKLADAEQRALLAENRVSDLELENTNLKSKVCDLQNLVDDYKARQKESHHQISHEQEQLLAAMAASPSGEIDIQNGRSPDATVHAVVRRNTKHQIQRDKTWTNRLRRPRLD